MAPTFPFMPLASRQVDADLDEDFVDLLYDRDEGLRERSFFLPLVAVSTTTDTTFAIKQNWFVRVPIWAEKLHIIVQAEVTAGETGTIRGRIEDTLLSDNEPTETDTPYDPLNPLDITWSDVSAYADSLVEIELQIKISSTGGGKTFSVKEIHGATCYWTV